MVRLEALDDPLEGSKPAGDYRVDWHVASLRLFSPIDKKGKKIEIKINFKQNAIPLKKRFYFLKGKCLHLRYALYTKA